jgi:light-regulated signal transduction histidine kinase (bacteriophytochrome)
LRTIHGFSQILLDEHASQLPPEGQRYLRMVHSGAGQLGSLIDDLLTFSRLGRQALERKPVDTRRLVEQIIEHHQKDQPEREVEFALGELPPCEGDPSMIRSVWTNLLSNAVKFTRPRSPGRIEVGSSASPEGQVYFVRDNGVGFDMTYAHKLFGVFQRLHRSEDFEGTGVGLAIVQRVTSRHGGRVWAESKVGEGTTFFFTLGGANGDSNGRG